MPSLRADSKLQAELINCETRVWNALVSGDMAADSASLDDNFLGVYSDGFSVKSDHVGQLTEGPTVVSYTLSEFHCRTLGEKHALLSYRADFVRQDKKLQETMYVSSVWKRTKQCWINVFSQDTPAAT